MRKDQAAAGVRVYWPGNSWSDPDSGTITMYDENVPDSFWSGTDSVWVRWDSDDDLAHIHLDLISLEAERNPATNEAEAVMLLLSLGYTITKNVKE